MDQGLTSIMVADHDLLNVQFTAFLLEHAGYRVTKAFDGPDILRLIDQRQTDLLLLDVTLPSASGFDICRKVRDAHKIPVIFLSGRGSIQDRVMGLRVGGDDYIVKPFDPPELLARIDAVLRRYNNNVTPSSALLSCGGVTLDAVNQTVAFTSGHVIQLTPIEYRVLHHLVEHAGRTVAARQIHSSVWGDHDTGEGNQVALYIQRLRSKIEPGAKQHRHIITVRKRGYKFEP